MPPRLARLLAAVVAIALVAGAFAVRGALSDDDGEGATGSGPDATAEPGRDGDETFRVLCDADLGEAACTAVEDLPGVAVVGVVDAGTALADLGGGAATEWDLWLTLDPLPGVVDTARRFAGVAPVTGDTVAVASSPLAVSTFADSHLVCDEPVEWTCLVEPVTPAVAFPSLDTAVGAIAAAAGAVALQGEDDFDVRVFADTAEADALAELIDESPSAAGTTAEDQTAGLLRPGTASAAIAGAGLADRRAGTPQGGNRGLRTVALTPDVTVGVVLVGLGERGAAALATVGPTVTDQTVRDALAEGGWAGDPGPTTGLPRDDDLVYALREDLR